MDLAESRSEHGSVQSATLCMEWRMYGGIIFLFSFSLLCLAWIIIMEYFTYDTKVNIDR